MIQRITGAARLPDEVVAELATRTDGVPLFVEELTKTVLESGVLVRREGKYELTGPLTDLAIPTTLQDSLEARLDRLGEAKEVAQLAAAIGREFSYELLQAVSGWEEGTLRSRLARLIDARRCRRR